MPAISNWLLHRLQNRLWKYVSTTVFFPSTHLQLKPNTPQMDPFLSVPSNLFMISRLIV